MLYFCAAMSTETAALLEAIELAKGQASLARKIGGAVRQGHIAVWIARGRVPEEHCPGIERETGVRCERLRPDVFWTRGIDGVITGYHVPLRATANEPPSASDAERVAA